MLPVSARTRRALLTLLSIGAISAGAAGCGDDSEPSPPETAAAVQDSKVDSAPDRTERGVPLEPGGDNSIQEYGSEAPAATHKALAPLVDSYVNAHARAQWGEVCSDLSAATLRELQQFVAGSKQLANAGCEKILSTLNESPSAFIRSQKGRTNLFSVRVEGSSAFAIFRASNGFFLYLPLIREGGAWKVTQVTPSPLLG
jgi:hypothetical protein